MKLLIVAALAALIQTGVAQSFQNDFTKIIREFTGTMHFYVTHVDKEELNTVFSPYSITQALGMTLAGAKNTTNSQIKRVLGFHDIDDIIVHVFLGWMYEAYFGQSQNPKVELANAMFIEHNYAVKKDFRQILQDHYDTDIFSVDFSKSQATSNRINSWVSKKTEKLITEIISPRSLNSFTRLVLTNAIYFKGSWKDEFEIMKGLRATHLKNPVLVGCDQSSANAETQQFVTLDYNTQGKGIMKPTEKDSDLYGLERIKQKQNKDNIALHWMMFQNYFNKCDFHVSSTRTVYPECMTRTGGYRILNDTENNMMFVAIPYLTDEGNDPTYFIIGMHDENILKFSDVAWYVLEQLDVSEWPVATVHIVMPKFEIEQELDVREILSVMGIRDLFREDRSNLSGITEDEQLFVSEFVHKARISVDEHGTEAAASTAIVLSSRSFTFYNEPLQFIVNKPFFYGLYNGASRLFTFMGQVRNPTLN